MGSEAEERAEAHGRVDFQIELSADIDSGEAARAMALRARRVARKMLAGKHEGDELSEVERASVERANRSIPDALRPPDGWRRLTPAEAATRVLDEIRAQGHDEEKNRSNPYIDELWKIAEGGILILDEE